MHELKLGEKVDHHQILTIYEIDSWEDLADKRSYILGRVLREPRLVRKMGILTMKVDSWKRKEIQRKTTMYALYSATESHRRTRSHEISEEYSRRRDSK